MARNPGSPGRYADDAVCSIPDCDRKPRSRGWCGRHYEAYRQHGDPLVRLPRGGRQTPIIPLIDRFLARFTPGGPDDCWQWEGTLAQDKSGALYGVIAEGSQWTGTWKQHKAHRVSYEHYVGPIPDGLTIDHLCNNTQCVNPAHLEPVTDVENTKRQWVRRRLREAVSA